MRPADTAEVRALVRELIRECLPEAVDSQKLPVDTGQEVEHVRLTTDQELNAFVQRIVALLNDPRTTSRLRAGQLVFRLTNTSRASDTPASMNSAMRFERGAVTEKAITEAHSRGAPVILGTSAVLTPLARDKARKLAVEVVKEDRC
jgi:hypothetical protein